MTGLLASLATNPVFAGIAGGATASAVLFQARALPERVWSWLHKRFTVTLVIDSSEGLFERLAIYLAASPYVQRARWLRMVEDYDYAAQRWKWKTSFGLGWHVFKDAGSWFLLHRLIEDAKKGVGAQRRETFTLRTFGQSQAAMRGLMKRAEDVFQSGEMIRVYVWVGGEYLLADHKPFRSFDTVFIPEDQKARLLDDMARFSGARELYRQRGTPWRRGYLLEGPPGTGKSTIAFVMACLAKRPVYMLNLNTAGGDTGLIKALNVVEPGAVVVIEDIDAVKVTHDRAREAGDASVAIKPEESVTLAGILNAIDGLASRENRILIITSNHADRLDPALLRPGRIDHRETIGLIGAQEARAMARAFLGERADRWLNQHGSELWPISPAELQGMLLCEVERAENVVRLPAVAQQVAA